MPKRDKNREMEERLARIEDGLARSDVNYAIRQLGDGLDAFKFDLTKGVESLSLYHAARNLDATRWVGSLGHAERLASLYGKVVSAFEAYQRGKAKTLAPVNAARQESIDRVVDNKIEAIPFGEKFSVIFRTAETRHLDDRFNIGERKGFLLAALGYGVTEIEMSNIMPIFEWLANKAGYFAGVRVDELKTQAKGFGLETHVSHGFVAVKAYQADGGVKTDIAVPVRFW